MLVKICLFFVTCSVLIFSQSEFTPDAELVERALKGEQIAVTKRIKPFIWPEVTIYDSIKATPLEIMAIFTDYPLQKTYIPRLIKANIIKDISLVESHVDFELNLPFPAPNSKYITANIISKEGNGFIVKWYQVSSNSAKESKGWARFIPASDKTLIIYRSFVVPKSIFAGLFKKKIVKEVKKTINALKTYVINLKCNSPKTVQRYCEKLQNKFPSTLYKDKGIN